MATTQQPRRKRQRGISRSACSDSSRIAQLIDPHDSLFIEVGDEDVDDQSNSHRHHRYSGPKVLDHNGDDDSVSDDDAPFQEIQQQAEDLVPGTGLGFWRSGLNALGDDKDGADVVVHLEEVPVTDGVVATGSVCETEVCSVQAPSEHAVKHSWRLHSRILVRSRYFAALLSERWQEKGNLDENVSIVHVTLNVSPSVPISSYITTLRLLYTGDFSGVIVDVPTAISILPVAAELLFDECITACVNFLEAVPWTKEQERQVVKVISYLQLEEASDLLARVTSGKETAVEDMLHELVDIATHRHQNAVSVKAFVAKILSNHSSRHTVKLVLDKAFQNSLKMVKDSVEEYSSPNVRGRYDEIEAMQRHNLHTAVAAGRRLLWLVERMIELRVAGTAVSEWSEQSAFTANLQKTFNEDVWRNNVPNLPSVLLRCTCRLANAMVSGHILASRDVRKKLVRDWLPVLVTSKENVPSLHSNKQLHQDLETVFLQLISTLPVPDAQELLKQCLNFASASVDDSSQLAMAFSTWFRRASKT